MDLRPNSEIADGVHSVKIINDFNKELLNWQSGKPVTGELIEFTQEIRRGKDQVLGKLLLIWDTGETLEEIAESIEKERILIAIFMAITGLVLLVWMHVLVINPVMRINQRLETGDTSEPLKRHWWTAREFRRLKNTVDRLMILRDWQTVKQELLTRGGGEVKAYEATVQQNAAGTIELPPKKKFPPLKEVKKKAIQEAERKLIRSVLAETGWNRKRAAQLLQISYKALLYKIKDYEIGAEY